MRRNSWMEREGTEGGGERESVGVREGGREGGTENDAGR